MKIIKEKGKRIKEGIFKEKEMKRPRVSKDFEILKRENLKFEIKILELKVWARAKP